MPPPLLPLHVHVRGQLPLTDDAVPAEHKFAVGLLDILVPFAVPHVPSPGTALLALQFAVLPPFAPAHVQLYTPSVADVSTSSFVPAEQ
ncbi:MAG: hypothetical protein LBP53_05165 [Candidatus Peribacteria bacterium]|nr:hypothetical protein [Candidatus Peribacteria bacterium]